MTGKFDITKELPEYTQFVSRHLYRLLEEIGASTALRDVRMKTCITNEIHFSVSHSRTVRPLDVSYYIFGSLSEGSTTHGLKSDIDIVYIDENVPVLTNIAESHQFEHSCLLIRDSNTPPGYAKLQYVNKGIPLYRTTSLDFNIDSLYIDEGDRFVVTLPPESSPVLTKHGPAESSKATKWSLARDFVQAYRCRTWPGCALGWLTRPRLHNWPSQEQINQCKTLGCFFVYVGHPCSSENDLQWRISFSLQERLCVTNFNSVQLKCFILLKVIKKEKIQKKLGKKSLTSYHFKTCMLYMIENTPSEFWTEENLLVCVHHCLGQMLVCVEKGECPNYFVPEENMFEGRIFKKTQNKLCKLLRRMLCADFMFLLRIKTDKLGRKLQEAMVPRIVSPRSGQAADMHSVQSGCIYNVFEILLTSRNRIYSRCQDTRIPFSALELYQIKCMLQQTDRVSEHGPIETREALSLLLPYADIALMSVLMVAAKRMRNGNDFVLYLLASEKWHAVSVESDLFSSKLKQASLLYMLGYCQFSLNILQSLEDHIGQQILSLCNCTTIYNPRHLSEYWPVIEECGTFEEFFHRHMIPCVVYLPAEKELTPPALCFEMVRAAGVPPNKKERYYNWAVVDGKVLLYFLLYLNHHHLNMEANAEADLDNIWWVVETDHLLRHKETAYNILGWIYKERGVIAQAMRCFQLSLAVKRTCNAAHLHLQSMATWKLKPHRKK